jgi:hypothetical protein
VVFFRPDLKGEHQLLLAKQALKGWHRLQPLDARLPLPLEMVALFVVLAWSLGRKEEAFAFLCIVNCYLRPEELFKARVQDLVLPIAASTASQALSVVLQTHEFDKCIVADGKFQDLLVCLAVRVLQLPARPQKETALQVKPQQLIDVMNLASCMWDLSSLGSLDLYRLRHTGASFDYLSHTRTLAEVQKRGRWRAAASVRRYKKCSGRIQHLLCSLPADVRNKACAALRHLEDVLYGRLTAVGMMI